MKGLTDIARIRVGHASDFDGLTGCTAILCEVARWREGTSADRRPARRMGRDEPCTSRTACMPWCFAGGSAFGLEAPGVRRFLEKRRRIQDRCGRSADRAGAILYDLGIGEGSVVPRARWGKKAAAAAIEKAVEEGAVGAGTGATVGKLLGDEAGDEVRPRLGDGVARRANAGVTVSALAVVNAVGDVRDPATGMIIAGARKSAGLAWNSPTAARDEEHGRDGFHAREYDAGRGGD